MNIIINAIKQHSKNRSFPDKTTYTGISVKDIEEISTEFRIKTRDIELTALESDIIPDRYVRNMKSFSLKDQIILLKSAVAIIGLGGLGGAVVEILARIGVGKLILIDGDSFEESNLNRQFLSSRDKLGIKKAEAAYNRVKEINGSVEAIYHAEFLEAENCDKLLEGADVVVDCLDNLKTRFLLEKAAKANNSVLVSGAVAGNTGQITVVFPEDEGLISIYGDPALIPEKGVETSLGTLSYAVTQVSCLECAEVIKILLKKDKILRNKLLIINPLDNLYEVMSLS